jgi:hypothetical protein
MTKFCSGICLFFVLMCVIWAPMLVRIKKIPYYLFVKIKCSNYESHFVWMKWKSALGILCDEKGTVQAKGIVSSHNCRTDNVV